MSGGQLKNTHSGTPNERLAELVLSKLAFVTRIPRENDLGADVNCVLAKPQGVLLVAGPFFTVQVKPGHGNIIYEKPHEIEWIKNQEAPFFIGVVDQSTSSLELYSTWRMLIAFMTISAKRIILQPNGVNGEFRGFEMKDGDQYIPLGSPVLKLRMDDLLDEQIGAQYIEILKEWVLFDRLNIANRHAGNYWISGPLNYKTNHPLNLKSADQYFESTHWNAKNLRDCELLFARAATALRLTIRRALGKAGEAESQNAERLKSLELVLKLHAPILSDIAKQALLNEVDLDVES